MTFRFRNPWVDPRVLDVRPSEAESYLRTRGWQEVDSGNALWKRFVSPQQGEREVVLVPAALGDEALVNLLVECVGKIAAVEGRYAGDVLDDLLSAPSPDTNGVPGQTPVTRH